MTKRPQTIALALTGASGVPYFLRMLERLRTRTDVAVHVICSEGGRRVLWEESGQRFRDLDLTGFLVHDNKNIGSCLASGSYRLDALVILPCSQNTLCAMAAGLAYSLITRTAAVQLKERRSLLVVPREMPLSLIALRAMCTLVEAGAVMMPASPSFYHQPKTLQDLLDNLLDRVLDQLGLEDADIKRWNP